MKLFLRKLIAFLTPVMIVLFVLEGILRILPSDYVYKREQLLANADNIQILTFGSSHGLLGINPSCFSLNGFNLANVSQTLDMDYALLEKYGPHLNNLKFVIVPISYFTLFTAMSSSPESWRLKNYAIYYDVDLSDSGYSPTYYFEILNGKMYSNISRLYGYIVTNGRNAITVLDNGHFVSTRNLTAEQMDQEGKAEASRHSAESSAYLFPYNKNIAEKIVSWCGKRGVTAIFVTLPTWRAYYGNLDNTQLNDMVDYMKSLDVKYDDVYYWNFIDNEHFTEEHLGDSHHLNEAGAVKLTELLDVIVTDIEDHS